MDDNFFLVLKHFELKARVFQAGPLCNSSTYDAEDGLGYIHVLKQGKLQLTTSKKKYISVEKPSLIFYMTPTHHQLTPKDSSVNMVCASFEFGLNITNPLARAFPEIVLLPLSDLPELSSVLELLFSEAGSHQSGRAAILDRYMEIIIIQLLRTLGSKNKISTGLLAGLCDPKISKSLHAIHSEPATNWTLESLATIAGMSRSRYSEKFYIIVGQTPMQYLLEWRIGLSQSLLRKEKSIQYIADTIGYSSSSAYSRAFSSVVGLTPLKWKKLSLENIAAD